MNNNRHYRSCYSPALLMNLIFTYKPFTAFIKCCGKHFFVHVISLMLFQLVLIVKTMSWMDMMSCLFFSNCVIEKRHSDICAAVISNSFGDNLSTYFIT